jgi:hypothetical protein
MITHTAKDVDLILQDSGGMSDSSIRHIPVTFHLFVMAVDEVEDMYGS